MPIYKFYSRQSGYIGGFPVKYFETSEIDDPTNCTNLFVDKSGEMIAKLVNNLPDSKIKNIILKYSEMYKNWYYYPKDYQITDTRLYV